MVSINLLCCGTKMPTWVAVGFEDYIKRCKNPKINLIEIPIAKRSKTNTPAVCAAQEAQALLTQIKPGQLTIVLDQRGQMINTEQLSKKLDIWQQQSSIINFIIGGPDGLDDSVIKRADFIWSLSPLTLPHPLARIVVIEQLYRAYCILNNHPYHK